VRICNFCVCVRKSFLIREKKSASPPEKRELRGQREVSSAAREMPVVDAAAAVASAWRECAAASAARA
jgi:hypothetical protein